MDNSFTTEGTSLRPKHSVKLNTGYDFVISPNPNESLIGKGAYRGYELYLSIIPPGLYSFSNKTISTPISLEQAENIIKALTLQVENYKEASIINLLNEE